ncbi:MAG: DUF1822 family protein [Rivularia sp. (in: Bacteria)]|nr:DUF1822 family protein [Rivularia sp. MS3]
MLKFDALIEIHPNNLWIEFSSLEKEAALKQTATNNYQSDVVSHRAFINRLCLSVFLKWLQEEPDLLEKFSMPAPSSDIDKRWQFVNGIDLNFTQARLVLVPTEESDCDEFRIPQEWVDIPNWAANYYLAVQLNLEQSWLKVSGFISHEQLRQKAQYDSIDRTYCINCDDLIADINIMWVAQKLCTLKKPQVQFLPTLLESEAKQLIEQLSQISFYSPRLHLRFAQWGAILASEKYREALYNHRINHLKVHLMENSSEIVLELSSWFHNVFSGGFCSVDDLLNLTNTTAFQFRSDSVLNEVCVKGAKLIDLGMQLESNSVALLIGLSPQIDNKVGIRVQLYPASGEVYLPDSVQLTLLSESGATLQSVKSRSYDNYIQLKRFKLPLGKYFSIQVARKDVKIKENFILEGFSPSKI